MSQIDTLISQAAPRTDTVRVCARGDLVDLHREVVVELQQWLSLEGDTLAVDSNARALNDRLAEIEAEIEASTVTFRLAALPAYKWANFLVRYAPNREQRQAGCEFDPDEFPPAVIAASVVDPEPMSVDQAKQLRNAIPQGEWQKLWVSACALNVEETPRPKLAGVTAAALASDGSSTPSSLEESLGAPSSAGEPAP